MVNKIYIFLIPIFLFIFLSFYLNSFNEKIVWNYSIDFKVNKFSEECVNKSIKQNGGAESEATGVKWNFITQLSINDLFKNSTTSTIVSNDNNVKISFSKINFNPNNENLSSIKYSLQRYKEALEINCV